MGRNMFTNPIKLFKVVKTNFKKHNLDLSGDCCFQTNGK